MMLGLRRGTVALVPHETAWEEEAARTVETLKTLFGETAADVQHVGSTSVRAVMAKPIVDIAVAATDLDAALKKRDALSAAGFYYRPTELPEQLLFARGSYYEGTGEEQTHFIHVVRAGSKAWRDYLNFRNYLNAVPSAAKEYEALKLRLAAERPADPGRAYYLAGKQAFIARALVSALAWSYLGERVRIVIDRPVGYAHRRNGRTLRYPINYGYLPGTVGGDGEALDAYLLGVSEPVKEADARVVGVVLRKNDVEDKLIAAPEGAAITRDEMAAAVRFQERWFDAELLTPYGGPFPM